MKRSAARLVVVLAAPLLLGCSGAGAGPEPATSSSPSAAVTGTTAPADDTVAVPNLVGLKRPAATRLLRASSLEPQAFWTGTATCRGTNVVLRQRPQPGRLLERGDRVVILTGQVRCGPLRRRSSLDAEATRVADDFAGFARGDAVRPPHTGSRVALLLGGMPAGQVPADRIEERRSWRGCSNPRGYAAAMCPLDFLGSFISAGVNRTALVYSMDAPVGVCLVENPGKAYGDLVELDRLVIAPARRMASCANDFRYELFLGERGALIAVNLVLTDP